MRTREIVVKVPGPRLPIVLREIVDRLCSDDWERRSTEDDDQFYYIIGEAASASETNFKVSEFPAAKATAQPKQAGPPAEWHVRSQIAGRHPNYLRRARRRLEDRGVSASAIDRFLEEEKNLEEFFAGEFILNVEGLAALTEFVQAWQIFKSEGQPRSLDEEDAQEVDTAREKMYLQEITKKFAKILERGAELEPVSFEDPQLEEASRCYLCGFYRASIVLSAAAVEMHLKRLLRRPEDSYDKFSKLVDDAKEARKLPACLAESALEISRARNPIAHAGLESDHDKSLLILGLAKKIIDHLSPLEQ